MEILFSDDLISPAELRCSFKLQQILFGWYEQNINVLSISGARNTSKSHTIALLNFLLCAEYPGCKICVVRKEQSTIKTSVIETYDELLYHGIDNRKKNPFYLYGGIHRPESVNFENGSQIVFAGMNTPEAREKVRGTAWDVVWLNEVTRISDTMDAFSEIAGAMAGGRAGNIVDENGERRFLIIGDTNPASKKHWWYRIFNAPEELGFNPADYDLKMEWLEIGHKDHPLMYNHETKEDTEHGKKTVNQLLATHPPGHTRDRLVHGLWSSPEGAVFPEYDPVIHDVDINREFFDDFPKTKWYYACDWGNFIAVGLYADTGNGKHYLFKEIYCKGTSLNDVAVQMQKLETKYRIPKISNMFVDHEGTSRNILREHGYTYTLTDKTEGIVASIEDARYALQNGLIYFNRNSLDNPDAQLIGKPRRLTDEIGVIEYKSPDKMTGAKSDDLPDPQYPRHAIDHWRYYIVGNVVKDKRKIPRPSKENRSIKIGTPQGLF